VEQNGTNTTLTGKKLKVAEALANPEVEGSITELLDECGVPRTTFYRWIKNPSFLAEVEKLIDTYTDAELGIVWKSLIAQCAKGNVRAIQLYFEVKNKYKTDSALAPHGPLTNLFERLSEDD